MNRSDTTDCKKVRENLNRYIDNDLKSVAASECAAHLSKCETCRALHAQLRGLRVAMKGLSVPAGGDAAQTRVFQKLERTVRTQAAREKQGFASHLFRGRPVFAALSAALVVGVGLVVLLPSVPTNKPVEVESAGVPLPKASEMSVLFQMHDAHAVASAAADGDAVFDVPPGASGNGAL